MKAVIIVISVHLIFGVSHNFLLVEVSPEWVLNQALGPRKSVLIP